MLLVEEQGQSCLEMDRCMWAFLLGGAAEFADSTYLAERREGFCAPGSDSHACSVLLKDKLQDHACWKDFDTGGIRYSSRV